MFIPSVILLPVHGSFLVLGFCQAERVGEEVENGLTGLVTSFIENKRRPLFHEGMHIPPSENNKPHQYSVYLIGLGDCRCTT